MLGWTLVLAFFIVSYIAIHLLDEYNDWWVGETLVGFAALVCVFIMVIQLASVPYYTNKFNTAKEYIESHQSNSALEDVSLTNTKIEMNDWLFAAQASNETFGIFSFFPDSVHDIEPIR